MENFDDIFKSEDESKKDKNPPFDKAAWIEQKQLERDQAYTMMADTAEKIKADGSVLQRYLDVQSRFNRYSVGNALLVTAQLPDATRLADFEGWKKSGAYVKKGATSITLLEPGEEYTREDHSIGVSFNTKKMFDVSQTSLADQQYSPKKPDERAVIKALMAASPCKIKISAEVSEQNGAVYDEGSGMILIRQGMDGDRIIKTLAREIADVKLTDSPKESNIAFNAYCVSYMIAKRMGCDVTDYSFNKLPENYKSKDAKDLRAELGLMRDVANDMITEMNKSLEQQKTSKSRDQAR